MSAPADRGRVSRRLKAARWLAGTARNERGQVLPAAPAELAADPALRADRITANRIRDLEQERVDARPGELEALAAALGVPAGWFTADDPLPVVPAPDPAAALVQALLAGGGRLERVEAMVGELLEAQRRLVMLLDGPAAGPEPPADRFAQALEEPSRPPRTGTTARARARRAS